MRYSGSKKKLAKELIPIITQNLTEDKYYIELFAGGMNMIDKIDHKNKIANDYNQYVIDLWNGLKRDGVSTIPSYVTEDMYTEAKDAYLREDFSVYSRAQIGYIGNCCSYGGAWWNGYAHFNPNKNEDHIAEARRGLEKQFNQFKHIDTTIFTCQSYDTFPLPYKTDCVIYLDPPYASTKKYETDFDNAEFWNWVREKAKDGYEIYVSEYDAPSDFKCVWSKEKKDGMGTTKAGKKQDVKIEKLFIYEMD